MSTTELRQRRVQHGQDVKSTVFFIVHVHVIDVQFSTHCSCLNFRVCFQLMRIATGYCAGKTTVAEIKTLQLQPDLNMCRGSMQPFILEGNHIGFRVVS